MQPKIRERAQKCFKYRRMNLKNRLREETYQTVQFRKQSERILKQQFQWVLSASFHSFKPRSWLGLHPVDERKKKREMHILT